MSLDSNIPSGELPVPEAFRSAFRSTTGMPVDFISDSVGAEPYVEPESPFCKAAQRFPGAREACRKCRSGLLKQADTGPVTVTCWAGFAETAVPIKVRGKRTGFIVTGQVALRPLSRQNFSRLGNSLAPGSEAWKSLEVLYHETKPVDWQDYRERIRLLEVFRDQLLANPARPAPKRAAGPNAKPIRIRKLCDAVEKEFADEWSVGRAAKVACMSVFHFCRLFKKATGQTFNEYLNRIRVDRARERLAGGGETVTEIALSIGFQSISQFNRQFKTLTGLTPSEFRETV